MECGNDCGNVECIQRGSGPGEATVANDPSTQDLAIMELDTTAVATLSGLPAGAEKETLYASSMISSFDEPHSVSPNVAATEALDTAAISWDLSMAANASPFAGKAGDGGANDPALRSKSIKDSAHTTASTGAP